MTDAVALRLISIICMIFAVVLAILAMGAAFSPSLPAYVTFLFVGLVGTYASRANREVDRRLTALESRR